MKENQEYILGIDIRREAFDDIVQNAVASSWNAETGIDHEQWKEQVKRSDIRCQWDPERDVFGNPLEYRSIQLGLRGEAVRKYVTEWIVNITDITEYVKGLRQKKEAGMDITPLLPEEKVYICGR